MLEDSFTQLLKELSFLLDMELKPDENQSCLIEIQGKLKIQLEMDPSANDQLMIGSLLPELSSGRYRESILLSALRANAQPYPRTGTFSYSPALNCLVIFEMLPLRYFNGEKTLKILIPFIKKAHTWKEAIERSELTEHLEKENFVTNPTIGTLFNL